MPTSSHPIHDSAHRLAEPSKAVVYKGQHFRGLSVIEDPVLCTRRYRSLKGIVPEGASIFMPMLHGMGPMTSHAGSMLATLNVLTASKKKGSRSESLKALRELPHYQLVGGEAIDLPGSHGIEPTPNTQTLAALAEWIVEWMAPIKQSEGVSCVPIARSASAMLVTKVNELHPGLLDGLVLLSPMAPFDAEHSNADLLRRVAESECELNQVAFDYMNRLTSETNWDNHIDPFAGLPTLILTGEQDTQVSDRVRARCTDWATRLNHIRFEDVNAAGHDVFNLRNRIPGLRSYELLYDFLAALA